MKHQWRGTQTVLRVDCGKEEEGEEEEEEEDEEDEKEKERRKRRRERGGEEEKERRQLGKGPQKQLHYVFLFQPPPPLPSLPHLEVNKQFGVLSCDIMHLHHVWSVDQLLQLSHRESVQLAQFLL